MRRPRYMVFDERTHRYLREVMQVDGNPMTIATTYTRSAGKAQRFPGVKSARAMRDKLGESHLIHDERGNVIE